MRRSLLLLSLATAATAVTAPAETITNFVYTITLANQYSSSPLATTVAFSISSEQQPTVTQAPPINFFPGLPTIVPPPVYTYSNVATSVGGQSPAPFNISISQPGLSSPELGLTVPAGGAYYRNGIVQNTDSTHNPDAPFFFSVSDTGAIVFAPGTYTCYQSSLTAFGDVLIPTIFPTLTITQTTLIDPPTPPTAVTPEPASLALLGTGLAGLGTLLRRRSRT